MQCKAIKTYADGHRSRCPYQVEQGANLCYHDRKYYEGLYEPTEADFTDEQVIAVEALGKVIVFDQIAFDSIKNQISAATTNQ